MPQKNNFNQNHENYFQENQNNFNSNILKQQFLQNQQKKNYEDNLLSEKYNYYEFFEFNGHSNNQKQNLRGSNIIFNEQDGCYYDIADNLNLDAKYLDYDYYYSQEPKNKNYINHDFTYSEGAASYYYPSESEKLSQYDYYTNEEKAQFFQNNEYYQTKYDQNDHGDKDHYETFYDVESRNFYPSYNIPEHIR